MKPITPAQVAHFPRPGTVVPGRLRFRPDGRWLTYLFSERGDLARDLWRLELSTGERERWLEPPGALRAEDKLSLEEQMRRERQRMREVGITDYWWATDANVLLLPMGADLYRWTEKAGLEKVAADAMYPQISRDGSRIFFVRAGDLWTVYQGEERRLTQATGVTNGISEFIAQEELGRADGYWISDDGEQVAFTSVDERYVPIYPIVHQGTADVTVEEHHYPFAGARNALVRLGVVAATGGAVRWLDLHYDPDSCYLARAGWHPDGRLFIQVLLRGWQRLELHALDPGSGTDECLLVEQTEPWVNLHDDLRFNRITGEFTWSSERSGYRHLYLYGPQGQLLRQLTKGDWPVDDLVALDDQRRTAYFTAGKDSPLGSQIFAVSLDSGEPFPISEGHGIHSAVFSKGCEMFVEYFDNLEQPPAVNVRSLDGSASFSIHEPAKGIELSPPELHEFQAPDGSTLYAALYKPEQMQGKAAVIVEVYGGPGPQTVADSWTETVDLRAQMLRQHGFIVMKVDNRGSARRGLKFEGAIAHNFGQLEVQDQVAGLRWLDTLGIADLSRVGIYGWSYGGYMTIMAMLKEPDLFKVGVAGAPVTSWDGYDTAYTEKYMGKPQENGEGYRKSSALELAGRLKGKLLLIHGLIDENVHFRHTARLMQAFTESNRPYDVLLYPNERHMPRSEKDRVAMESRILEYFEKNL